MWYVEFWRYVVAIILATLDHAPDMRPIWQAAIPGGAGSYAAQIADATSNLPSEGQQIIIDLVLLLTRIQEAPSGANTPLINIVHAILGLFFSQL